MIVSLQDIKTELKINQSDEDTIITQKILSAQKDFEFRTNRVLELTDITMYLPQFDTQIDLQREPVNQLISIKFYDINDNQQTFTLVEPVLYANPPYLRINESDFPKISTTKANPIEIKYQAGYTSAPELIKSAIKLLVAHWYINRQNSTEKQVFDLPNGYESIVDKYRLGHLVMINQGENEFNY